LLLTFSEEALKRAAILNRFPNNKRRAHKSKCNHKATI